MRGKEREAELKSGEVLEVPPLVGTSNTSPRFLHQHVRKESNEGNRRGNSIVTGLLATNLQREAQRRLTPHFYLFLIFNSGLILL